MLYVHLYLDRPLGKGSVRLVADPEALHKFIIERLDEFMELVPAIDQALRRMTRR